MKRLALVLALWLPQLIRAQTQLTIQQPAPPQTGSVSASYSGPTTGGNIFYWVVVRYPAGAVNPVGPAIASGVTRANISAAAPVTITWAAVPGASGYDVVYADTSSYPANPTCTACGVSLNTSATSVTDTGAAGSAYPPAGLGAAGSATAIFNLNNVSEAAPYINIQLIGSSINNLYRLAPFSGSFTPGNCVKVIAGAILQDSGVACATGSIGTVTSVGLALPSFITVTGSPVTTTGTLTGTLATETANTVFAGPTTGAPAQPTFRALVAADIPSGIVSNLLAVTVSQLPVASNSGLAFIVKDALNSSDCSVGGGSFVTVCVDKAPYVGQDFVADPGANAIMYRYTQGASRAATVTEMSGPNFCQDAGGTDTYACTLSPAIIAYTTGTFFWFKANTTNTGTASVNFNGVGALTIVKMQGGITTTLADGDIKAGQWVSGFYDGTNFQMTSQPGFAGFVASGSTPSVGTCGTIGTGSKNSAGFITTATGACTSVLTFASATAPTGWSCAINNFTTPANVFQQTASSATTATFTGVSGSNDVISYNCIAY